MHLWLMSLQLVLGAIHGLGFARAYSPAAVPGLTEPISRPLGILWLVAGLLIIATAVVPARLFWIVGAFALIASQVAIGTSWSDAKLGTLVNLGLLLAVAYSFASAGPLGFAAHYRRDTAIVLARALQAPPLGESDLAPLPAPVQRYLRVTGSVGKPRVENVRARWRGKLRGAANDAWMTLSAEQVGEFGPYSKRFFRMNARMKGLPVEVYHRFVGPVATFRVRALSMIPIVSASGPELRLAETVTILNDMCLLAPATLIDPALSWQPIDDHQVGVSYTRGSVTVQAKLHFDDAGQLIDFVSDDRLRASADGKTFVQQRWSTPSGDYRSFAGRRVSAHAVARWHAPEGTFDYADFELESLEYNVTTPPSADKARSRRASPFDAAQVSSSTGHK